MEKQKYAVISRFYDDGKNTAQVVEARFLKEGMISKPGFDEYVDIFDDKDEAEDFAKGCLVA